MAAGKRDELDQFLPRRYLANFSDGKQKAEASKRLAELLAPDECDRLAGKPG